MFNIVRFTRRTCPALALALALTSCDSGTNEALTSFITGNSPSEHQQLQQTKNALAQMDQEISQAESHDARVNYNLQKRLSTPGKVITPFTVKDIDILPSKRRDFEHLCFDIEDMRKTLAQRKQEFHALQYQYNAYAAKLAEFKQSHPVD
ncbi:hypothetical protein [Akkermansia massiliensis]